MAGVVLTSSVLVAVGALLALAGYVAHRRGHASGRYLAGVGGVLILVGLVGLGYFVSAFG